jgi:S1-C subfamily serine protease
VYVLGSPADTRLESTLTSGIVSAIRQYDAFSAGKQKFIQADAAITGGNSGGPLLDENGNVIGITDASRTDANDVNLFIPIADALKALNITYGHDGNS